MKFGKLICTRIIKIVATRCQILRLKGTEFDFGWDSAEIPLWELTPLPRSPSWWQGAGCPSPKKSTRALRASILRPPAYDDSPPDLGVLE